MTTRLWAAIISLSGSLALAACAPAQSGGGPGGPSIPWGTEDLTISMTTLGTQTFDPVITTLTGSQEHMGLIHENFIGANTTQTAIGNQGGVTDRWEVSPDGKVYTLYLKPNARFQDGTPVTAEDVKFTWDRLKEPYVNSTAAGIILKYSDRAEVVDERTVKIYAKTPTFLYFDWLTERGSNESFVVPKAYIEQVGPEKYNTNPIGAGPYKLKNAAPGVITLEAVPEHFNIGVPRFKEIKFLLSQEKGTRLALLRTGEADIIEIGREDIPDLTRGGFNVFAKKGARAVSLFFYEQWVSDNPMSDPRVRKAISMGIDRKLLLDSLFGGQGELWPFRLANSNDILWQDRKVPADPYAYNPEAARRLLAEAGYPNGFDLNIYFFPRPGVEEIMKLGEAMGPMMSAIGLRPALIPQDWGAFRPNWIAKKLKNPAISPHAHNNEIADTMQGFWHSKGQFSTRADPKLDRMIDTITDARTVQEYKDLKWEGFQYGVDQQIVYMLFNVDVPFGTSQKIQKWETGRFASDQWNLKWLAAEESKRGW